MPRARGFVLTGLGGFLAVGAAGLPLVVSSPARAGQETAQYCPAGKPRPHYLQRLAARFDDRGNEDPADDRFEAILTLCGRADSRAAYKVSLDVRSPLFTDADRNGNGQVGRKDFCAETRDAVVRWPGRLHGDLGGDGVTSELVPGQGGMPDAIRFTVRVAALERAVGEKLPRDGSRTVFVWAHARPRAAAAASYAHAPDRRVVDRLAVPDPSDGCARPQAAAEALAVTLTDPATQTFDYTGNQQTYTVPQGVSSLKLTVTGASGGSGYLPLPGGNGGLGGPGAQVTGFLSVTPGQQLTINVGGGGGNAPDTDGGGGGTGVDDIHANAGGGGGNSGGIGGGGGGGGGGASSVVTELYNFVIAGGGGGGGGGGCFFGYFGGFGGGAGPQTGPNGGFGLSGSGVGAGAGGAAAAFGEGFGLTADDALGSTLAGGGGGGGAGSFGGDAGDSGGSGCGGGGGGGAGSNYTDPSVTGVVATQASMPPATNGSVVIDPQ